MTFFLSLVIDGALSGAVYALVATAFVVVYKTSRLANFALGEWVTLGAIFVGIGVTSLRLELTAAVVCSAGVVLILVWTFNRVALRHLVGRPIIAGIMITLGLSTMLRGATGLGLGSIPHALPTQLPSGAWMLLEAPIARDKAVAAAVAIACVAGVGLFYRHSRAGLALRALADDQAAAMAAGIDMDRYTTLAWTLAGSIALVAGVLWSMLWGGGFGLTLLGLKVFPVVVIGGLDSFEGAITAAMIVGLVESLAAGYGDPMLGGGFGSLASLVVLFVVLYTRPHGLFGAKTVQRI